MASQNQFVFPEMNNNSQAGNEASIKLTSDVVLKYYSERYPSFLIFPSSIDSENDIVKLPDGFILDCNEKIPRNITLQLPNGHGIPCKFKRNVNSLCQMTEFHECVRGLLGSIVVYSYTEPGRFNVSIIGNELLEVIYFQNRSVERGPRYDQDLVKGVGRKFLVKLEDLGAQFAEIPVPSSFCRNFGKYVNQIIHFNLRNGTIYDGRFSNDLGRLDVPVELYVELDISEDDNLLFTYAGDGNFVIMIFDKFGYEKCLTGKSNESGPSAAYIEISDEVEELVHEDVDEIAAGIEEAQINVHGLTFSSVLCNSNIDGKSHGVYIPSMIKPANRNWLSGERVTLRTENGEWSVGIVISGTSPRFSSGWSSFCRDNALRVNENLDFTLFDFPEGPVFDVLFPGRV